MPNNKVVVWSSFLLCLIGAVVLIALLVAKGKLEPGDLRWVFGLILLAVLYFSKISHIKKNGGEISDEEVDSFNFYPEDSEEAAPSDEPEA